MINIVFTYSEQLEHARRLCLDKKKWLNEVSYSWVMFCCVRFSLWLHSPGRLPFFLDPYLPTWYTVVFFGTSSEPDYKILQSSQLFLSKKQKKKEKG